MRQVLSINLLLVIGIVSIAYAESDYFPVVEKCIADPTLPPTDWTYDGTIMMSGYAGIHGMNAEWDTPHVLAFFRLDKKGNYPIEGGQLSSDSQWYATPMGSVETEPSFNNYWYINGLRVFNLADTSDIIDFSLDEHQDIFSYFVRAWSDAPVEWLDDKSLVIGGLLIAPFDKEFDDAPFNTSRSILSPQFFSPDKSLVYSGYPIGNDYLYGIYDPRNPEATFIETPALGGVSWNRNSSGFITVVKDADFHATEIAYIKSDGSVQDHIMQLDGSEQLKLDRLISGRSKLRWSPDNRYVGFVWYRYYVHPSNIYLVDMQAKQIIDTCLQAVNYPIWSSDGKQLAYLKATSTNQQIIVIDFEAWKAYIIGKHIGTSSEMVGWRD